MRALMYLTKRSLINNLKKAVHKPSTLIALIFGVAYGIFIVISFGSLAVSIRLDSVRGLLIIITVWSIYSTLGNFMSYSSRKGILFKPAHAHFVFTAPVSPKLVLLNGAWMNYLVSTVLWMILAAGGDFLEGGSSVYCVLHSDLRGAPGGSSVYEGDRAVPCWRDIW